MYPISRSGKALTYIKSKGILRHYFVARIALELTRQLRNIQGQEMSGRGARLAARGKQGTARDTRHSRRATDNRVPQDACDDRHRRKGALVQYAGNGQRYDCD